MTAALENRRQAVTAFEKADAERWMAAILMASAHGEDCEQFIPKPDRVLPELEMEHPLLQGPAFEEFTDVFDAKAAAAGRDE